jgi:hypothetical protein
LMHFGGYRDHTFIYWIWNSSNKFSLFS